jgi:Mlc titration factor MtfA (ptsG expression regulator)
MMFYSNSTGGFYTKQIHGENIPDDAVEISDELHAFLIEGQSQNKTIVGDANGFPILADSPDATPTYAQSRAAEYPDFRDYLDGVVKGDQAQIDAYVAACLAVKAKYPRS